MKLTVLGKYGPYPKAGTGATSGYLLEEGDTKIALDMGSGTLARLMAATNLQDLSALYISHLHFDHTGDLLPLRYLLDDLDIKLNVITQYEDSDWYRVLFGSPRFNVINIDACTELKVGGLKLTFFEMKHPARDYAIRAEGEKTFVYTGDTKLCDELYRAAEGADCVLCGCAKPAGFTGPHMAGDDAVKFAEETGVKIIATHFAPSFNAEKDMPKHENIILAEEGKTYTI
ncbi:MAG: MBL fold metallo-hydrolase [Clostridia bacterium]|nr:MBL fold metallo-hydrolase [Clostridia bacterium]